MGLITKYSELGIAEQAAAALANMCYDSDANRCVCNSGIYDFPLSPKP